MTPSIKNACTNCFPLWKKSHDLYEMFKMASLLQVRAVKLFDVFLVLISFTADFMFNSCVQNYSIFSSTGLTELFSHCVSLYSVIMFWNDSINFMVHDHDESFCEGPTFCQPGILWFCHQPFITLSCDDCHYLPNWGKASLSARLKNWLLLALAVLGYNYLLFNVRPNYSSTVSHWLSQIVTSSD